MQNHTLCEVICKVKTTVLLLLLLAEVILVYRYSFYLDGEAGTAVYNIVLILNQFINSLIFQQICYFYAKKAAHYISENKKILKIMRIVLYFTLSAFVGILIWQGFYIKKRIDCKNWSFLCASLFN